MFNIAKYSIFEYGMFATAITSPLMIVMMALNDIYAFLPEPTEPTTT
ncbi:hypothetical protein [Clostridium sp. CF012]|nr:hypothetical protein [Clostridium sp. CF012]MBU3146991.1 hypothetical protein [Clostridium sp. CF012]